MLRYCMPDPAALDTRIAAPTGNGGAFTQAVRAYAGLVPVDADAEAPNWRIHDSVALATPKDYFFAIATGRGTRGKRWKKGGAEYARSGLHTRLSPTIGPDIHQSVVAYDLVEGEGAWQIQFAPDYVAAAFRGLLGSEPMDFWAFAAWLLRTVRIPEGDPSEVLRWVERTVMNQARLGPSHVATTREEAVAQSAWFFTANTPDPDTYLTGEPVTHEALVETCQAYDERAAELQADGDEENHDDDEEDGDADEDADELRQVLFDAGDGRRLLLEEEVVSAALTHLRLGRHILFVGPPGTGKSTLAANLARAASREMIAGIEAPSDLHVVTAAATWTAFDTLGGYVPTRAGDLQFRPGVFLRAFEADAWLVIDEMNRADADKAFGPFMGVLARSKDVSELPYEIEHEGTEVPVRLVPSTADVDPLQAGDYMIPPDWRLIGTMNTYDKNSLFRLSYAFMRRFAFVYVGALDVTTTLNAALQGITLSNEDKLRLGGLLQTCESVGRPMGVAIATDVARYVAAARQHGDIDQPFLDAIAAHVLPQLDSLEPDQLRRARDGFIAANVVAEGNRDSLETLFREMLDFGR